MKRSLLLFVLAACGAALSADPAALSTTPFRLDMPRPETDFDLRVGIRLRLDMPIGPVRLNYGIPVRADHFTGKERYSPVLDAPGPGYRELLQRLYGP